MQCSGNFFALMNNDLQRKKAFEPVIFYLFTILTQNGPVRPCCAIRFQFFHDFPAVCCYFAAVRRFFGIPCRFAP